MILRHSAAMLLLAVLGLLAGCASAPPEYTTQTRDPWEKFNRATYAFNDRFDKAIARPVARTYVRAVPKHARSGIHNFIENLGEPVNVFNDVLQARGAQALRDTGRFLINSTFGLLGFFDVAAHVGLPEHDEDFGQTLARWGVPSGPYLVLPILGPSTLRDAGGRYTDTWLNPVWDNLQVRYRNGAYVVEGVDTRAGLMDLNATLDSAYDPYSFMRDAWIQHRRFDIYDGNPPVQYPDYPDLPEDDDPDALPAPAASSSSPPRAAILPVSAQNNRGG
ncbi:MAG TPA: VacJ family lipoprotein [Gammaproteobacteria bacterium]|nr:VacJ family lipoprotein [Gammaproteobacteria bacterium]